VTGGKISLTVSIQFTRVEYFESSRNMVSDVATLQYSIWRLAATILRSTAMGKCTCGCVHIQILILVNV
jgi:hypothetical protein